MSPPFKNDWAMWYSIIYDQSLTEYHVGDIIYAKKQIIDPLKK